MKCNKCNNEISIKATFCPNCGVKLKKKKGCITWFITICIILLIIGLLCSLFLYFLNTESSVISNDYDEHKEKTSVIPVYEIITDELTEQPFKTMVIMKLAITGKVTKTNIRSVLQNVFLDVETAGNYKYHSEPTLIAIHLFTSPQLARKGVGRPVATLHKNGLNTPPRITINEEMIKVYNEKPETKYGYTEVKRKEIFKELVAAEDKARMEAENRFPINKNLSGEKLLAESYKQEERREMLNQKYESIVETKYGLSSEQNIKISVEGLNKNWPMPALPE